MGLNCLFFFIFSIVVLHVFHVKMLSLHYLSKKMRVSTICTPAPPRPNCKKTWKTKIHLMTYIMTKIMINIMINVMTYLFMNIMVIIMINIVIHKMMKNYQCHD